MTKTFDDGEHTLGLLYWQATCNGEASNDLLRALTDAPFLMSNAAMLHCPCNAATCNVVKPSWLHDVTVSASRLEDTR